MPNIKLIKNCLELKYIDVSDLGLKSSNLEEFNESNNNIGDAFFRGTAKLKTVYLNNKKFENLFKGRLEAHVQGLIANYSQAKRSEFLAEIESLTSFLYLLSPETKTQLRTLLENSIQTSKSEPIPAKLIISLGLIALLILGVFYLLANKWIKKLLAASTFPSYLSKKSKTKQ